MERIAQKEKSEEANLVSDLFFKGSLFLPTNSLKAQVGGRVRPAHFPFMASEPDLLLNSGTC